MRPFRALATTVAIIAALAALGTPQTTRAQDSEAQKAVLVTGASSGIGRATAERLANAGYLVYAGARSKEDLDSLNAIDNIRALRLDVTVQDEIDAAAAMIEQEGRGLWGIVNNAGVNQVEPLIEADFETLDFIFDVNVNGVFRVTKAFAPLVIESGGRIVNVSSISGFISGGFVGYGMYSMSKHAIEAYTDTLAFEMQKFGVHVAAVEPGNYGTQIGFSRCRRMLATTADKAYEYFAEEMAPYFEWCRERFEGDKAPSDYGPSPEPVAAAIEDALFSDTPKEHYLVVPEQVEAMITLRIVLEELVQLNRDHEFSYTRDQLVEMLDEELAILAGKKERGWDNL